jgi:Trypsin-like peptidase domain
MIEGDNADGTGFLVKMPEGPAIATNLHVLAANPHLRIHTNTGAEITVTGLKGAADRDLALLSIQDDHYSYLDLNRNITGTVRIGDEIITPGNSEGGGVVLNTHGSVVALGPDRIEFSNPIYHGNSGGPVFHPKTGQILGVVTEALKVDTGNDLDKASFASRNSAIKASMRYFGLRLDTVSKWEIYNIDQFLNETTFLKEFHRQSRRLDSYLNSTEKTDAKAATSDSEDDDAGLPNSKLYLTDAKIVKANDDFFQEVRGGADGAQRLDALRNWLFTLNSVADTGVAQMQNPNNFYQFDQQRVREELSYRNALKKELDSCGDDISRVESLGHRSN